MKSVVVLSGFSAVLFDEDELLHPEMVSASVAAMAKARNVIASAYENPCV